MRKLGFLITVMILISSCVSGPKAAPVAKAPDWVLTTPVPDATNTYFVASSSSPAGDVALATEDAASSLISQIMRYMGVDINVQTTGVAKGTLDSYSAEVTAVVKQNASGKLSGFSIKDRYVAKEKSGLTTVYVLAAYITVDLNKEKARIAPLFKEKEDAVSKPEGSGDAAVSAGRWFDAVKFYVEAAVAASGSGIDNADIKMERNVNKARGLLGKLRFVAVDSPLSVNLGKEYPKSFKAKLVFGEGDTAPGIPGAEVYVSYQKKQTSGRVTAKTERVMSDKDGIVSFMPPAPDFVGKAKLSYSLNLDSTKDLIDQLSGKFAAYSDALFEDLSRRSVDFEYLITSAAKTVPTGVAIVDLLDDGKAATTSIAQGGLFESLAKEKFKAGLAPIDVASLVAMNDSQVLITAKGQYGASLKRYIYGTVRVESAVKDGSMWQATARMVVKCVDFETGMILYSAEKTSIAVAADEAGARRAAMLQVSRDVVGKDIMANLP